MVSLIRTLCSVHLDSLTQQCFQSFCLLEKLFHSLSRCIISSLSFFLFISLSLRVYCLPFSPSLILSPYLAASKEYQEWVDQFDVQSRQSEISQLLVSCPHVRTMHGQLVPAKVSYEGFWQHYFFKMGLLQQVSITW